MSVRRTPGGRVRNRGVLTARSLLADAATETSLTVLVVSPPRGCAYALGMTVAVSAHKGGSEDAPSGSLRAYESAVGIGAEYVEFDIRRTRDEHFVVFHDPVIEGRQVNE